MGLIEWLDKIVFGEDFINKCKNKNQTSNPSFKKPDNSSFTKEYDEGPVHIKREYNDGGHITFDKKEKTIEGKVIRILGEKTMHGVTGTSFLLETLKGNAEIEFPRIFSEDILSKIQNQTIKYCQIDDLSTESWDGPSGGCNVRQMEYKIEILSGPLKERYFQDEKTYCP